MALAAFESGRVGFGGDLGGGPVAVAGQDHEGLDRDPVLCGGIAGLVEVGIVFYVVAIPLFSPRGWRVQLREVHLLRLASVIVSMGFVVYLIYAELQIGSICEYCTGVHIVTFLLFCITVFSAAIWGFSAQRDSTSPA